MEVSLIGGSVQQYTYKGYAIVTKVRVGGGGLVYQVIRLSDNEKLGTFSTFADAQAAIDDTLQQAA